MNITINGMPALIKKGTSFDYVSENRLFGGADGYTLSVIFPLKGCSENIAIFGHINRADALAGELKFDAEIRDGAIALHGCFAITEISDTEVKAQFLDGRSENNFDCTFADIYINELDLGKWPTSSSLGYAPYKWNDAQHRYVALPWISPYSAYVQNGAYYDEETGDYVWEKTTTALSWQPYLIWIAKEICRAVGYSCDFSAWEGSTYKDLLLCNTFPAAWNIDEFARALPHWTVEEFFINLEPLLAGEFDIDHRAKSINFAFSCNVILNSGSIAIDNVLEEIAIEVSAEDNSCSYIAGKNFAYKEADHNMQKFYNCDETLRGIPERFIMSYKNMTELLEATKPYSYYKSASNVYMSFLNYIYYSEADDAYFILRCVAKELIQENNVPRPNVYGHFFVLQPINFLAPRIVDATNKDDCEVIEAMPAYIDYVDDKFGFCLYLDFGSFAEEPEDNLGTTNGNANRGFGSSYRDSDRGPVTNPPTINGNFVTTDTKGEVDATIPKGTCENLILNGTKSKPTYYDGLFIAYYDGFHFDKMLPHPVVDKYEINREWQAHVYMHNPLNLVGHSYLGLHNMNIDPSRKYTFKVLADEVPNVRAVFVIRNKRYICEKVTATFTENGMSRLMKIEAWPLVD